MKEGTREEKKGPAHTGSGWNKAFILVTRKDP